MIKITILLPLVLLAFSLVGSISDPWGCGCTPTTSSTSDDSTSTSSSVFSVFAESQDDGNTWSLDSLFFARKLTSCAYGLADNVFLIAGQDTAGKAAIWRSIDYGFNWTQILTTDAITFEDLTCATTLNHFVAVDDNGDIYLSIDDGLTWELKHTAPRALKGVDFFDAPLAQNQIFGTAVGVGGTIVGTTDGGNTWSSRASGTTNDLYAVHGMNSGDLLNTIDTIVCVGENGAYVYSHDGGFTWNSSNLATGVILKTVAFSETPTGRYGMAAGNSGVLFKTTNHGLSWQSVYFPYAGNVEEVIVAANGKCIALSDINNPGYSPSGAIIYRSVDAGYPFTQAGTINNVFLYKLAFRSFAAGGYVFGVGIPL